ncbi:TPA: hypothetical protein EYG96_00355 [Candidatus Gracilibacteria bacterium]|nr:hypothetical protein [Candidatus Peregrinibacteria bacterium]HIQ56480.1 hypothetical protein [Candidatus Gracilibacteria bacterium]HIQ57405.1 hypothetical protein [Candidatus Gracilibacteria bacterium]
MFTFFTESSNFYYTLITASLCIAIYIITKKIFIAYKTEKESIKQALQKTQKSLSLRQNFTLKKDDKKYDAIVKNIKTTNIPENITSQATKESLDSLNRIGEISKLTQRAEVLIGQKQYKEAEKIMIQALSYDETHKKSLEIISQIYLSLEQYSKAIFFLENFFKYHKENVATCNNYALAHFYTKDFPTTISYYSKAIALEPDNAIRYENLGKIFIALENYEDASKCYIEASKLDIKNIEYHKIIADCLRKETNYVEAKKRYEKILEFSPYEKTTLQALEDLKKLGF